MKQYIAIFEIDDSDEIVGDIDVTIDYTYRRNGTCYRHKESIDSIELKEQVIIREETT